MSIYIFLILLSLFLSINPNNPSKKVVNLFKMLFKEKLYKLKLLINIGIKNEN